MEEIKLNIQTIEVKTEVRKLQCKWSINEPIYGCCQAGWNLMIRLFKHKNLKNRLKRNYGTRII